MSYCRMGPDSDLYLIKHMAGGWACYSCALNESNIKSLRTRKAVLEHFLAHKEAGHLVPQRAIERIKSELQGETK